MKLISTNFLLVLYLFLLVFSTSGCSHPDENNKIAKQTILFLKKINSFFENKNSLNHPELLEKIIKKHEPLLKHLRKIKNLKYDLELKKNFHAQFKKLMHHVIGSGILKNQKFRKILNPVFQ